MRVLRTLAELRDWRRLDAAAPLHFVPTMGALHAGHQHLIRRAGQRAAAGPPRVLVSVFVNPLQFGPGEDLDRYPRDLASDQQLALAAGADGLLAPDPALLYPHGLTSVTRVVPPPELEQVLCGHARPGHFIGVATVVCRLLALVRPDRLLLGEKDWQQLVILRRVVADLGLPVLIEGVATVREEDGLACSSRNRYLDAAARARAAALPAALGRAHALQAGGQRDASVLCAAVRRDLEAAGLVVDHVAATRAHNLQAVERVEGPVLLAAAVQCGAARLIDHVVLMPRPPIVAVDGPAGAGKSTVTRALAQRLGLLYLDTGAMYRALTWWLQRQGVDPADAAAIAPLLEGLELQLDIAADGSQLVAVNGEDVTAAIRSPEVTAAVSAVAAHGCVRQALTAQQRRLGERGGLVAEGRDIGTAVFPDAEVKIFLTATAAERARRRARDLQERGFAVPALEELEQQIRTRDHQDSSRAVAPLRQAVDAVELLSDGLTIEAVIERLVLLVRERVPEEAWPQP